MFNIYKNKINYVLISFLILLFDQSTKYYLYIKHESLIGKNLFLFSIDYVKNYGAAFNIFSGSRLFLSIISLIISIILIVLIFKRNNLERIDLYAYTFILGGSLGNGFSRIYQGYVIDFINLNFINFPVFNIADISINIGFILFIYSLIKNKN